ncbi:di-heme oxidoredictase family protein [Leptospira selangorensis]|uniref:di-heme oxidoreductase family protein n=1 Tax=Leptospira selangorensis TaxID=2484982 RepID=UPI001FD21B1D|nr:di-heme oxidoredictase family protein [Leptospira selangorensis]
MPLIIKRSIFLFSISLIGCSEIGKQVFGNGNCNLQDPACGFSEIYPLVSVSGSKLDPWEYEEGEELSGGKGMTSYDFTSRAYLQFASGLPLDKISDFTVGQSVFEVPWENSSSGQIDRRGLGPLFNANSCLACHVGNGIGKVPSGPTETMLTALVRLSNDPNYGGQFQPFSLSGVPAEGKVSVSYSQVQGVFKDGTPYTLRKPKIEFSNLNYGPLASDGEIYSLRNTSKVIGMGLLEAIPDETLLSLQDEYDSNFDGISGRVNSVPDIATGTNKIGRFGWKSNEPNLKQQGSRAFLEDIGVTSPLFPFKNCTSAQTACDSSPHGNLPELNPAKIDMMVKYMRLIAVPARRSPSSSETIAGKKIFFQAGCSSCHISKLLTGNISGAPEISGQIIRPYTDLLLHDMGEGLKDGRSDHLASGREWRTPPLWGIGLVSEVNGTLQLLHDGRAESFMEAVLWHGGEAERSKQYVLGLSSSQRDQLVRFLESL